MPGDQDGLSPLFMNEDGYGSDDTASDGSTLHDVCGFLRFEAWDPGDCQELVADALGRTGDAEDAWLEGGLEPLEEASHLNEGHETDTNGMVLAVKPEQSHEPRQHSRLLTPPPHRHAEIATSPLTPETSSFNTSNPVQRSLVDTAILLPLLEFSFTVTFD
ncbi:uncharacterized protein PAC_12348 [Phialocephala subalpina]|uniref:Uncharacterized protein n=1 Tax=Phialocephala subalpina TaxID=576137 RepID=A0A1L7XBQ2_9HELO|nr:uncharacterized protein PAC_12348 [Phialocephala subalpina]